MNTRIFLLLTFLIPISAFSQFTVNGKINDPENIENLNIFISYGDNLSKRFPAIIEGDTFHISEELPEPRSSILTVENAGDDRGFKLLLDNHSTYQVDVLLEDNPNVFGENWYQIETDSEFHNTWRFFFDVQGELTLKIREVKNAYEKGEISKDELDDKVTRIKNEKNQKFKDLAKEKPTNFSVPYILTGAPDLSKEYFLYYLMLDEKVKKSFWGKKLEGTLKNFGDLDQVGPNTQPILGSFVLSIEGKTIAGEIKKYSEVNLDSKLTLIDFWASWCAPCRKENMRLGILNNDYEDGDFKIISYSLDNNLERWKNASLKDNITWDNISDLKGTASKTIKDFQIKQLPRNVLIDSNGKIVAVDKFDAELEEFVRDYLNISRTYLKNRK